MDEVIEFSGLIQEVRGAADPACLKLQPQIMTYENTKTGKVETYTLSAIKKLQWILRGTHYCMKIFLKDDTTHRVDGFKDVDYEKLSSYIEHFYGMKLEKKDMSLKGWNWGDATFNANTMEFVVDGLTTFEIPLSNISRSQMAKNEVMLEFHQNAAARVSLMEMRFHVSSDSTSETDPVQAFYDKVMAKPDVIQASGDAITIFHEVQCQAPRGCYDIKIYHTFLLLHGKEFEYNIPYSTILSLFLLPHRDSRHWYFVICLDTPIERLQKRCCMLVLLFNKDNITLELLLTEQELEKYHKLCANMSGTGFLVFGRIMSVLVKKQLKSPKSFIKILRTLETLTVPESFFENAGTHCISCSFREATGFLYLLKEEIIFMSEHRVHIHSGKVKVTCTCTVGNGSIHVETKERTVHRYTFAGIKEEEYRLFVNFVRKKTTKKAETTASYPDDDDSDVDDHNAFQVKMKAEGKERTGDEGDDDDEDESDEDFQPLGSVSELDDEYVSYDSNASSTSESDEEDDDNKGSDTCSTAEPSSKIKKEAKKASNSHKTSDESDIEVDVPQPSKPKYSAERPKSKAHGKSKAKKEKDCDKPKRPQTAYFLWFNESRQSLKDTYPGLSVSDLAKKAYEKWKEVKDKSKWEQLAAEGQKNYEAVMIECRKKDKGEATSTSGKKSQKKITENFADAKSKEFISESDNDSSDLDKPLQSSSKTNADRELPEGSSGKDDDSD